MKFQLDQMLACITKPPIIVRPGKPYVAKLHGTISLHFDSLSVQSRMSINMPDQLMLSYTRTMMSFLLLNPSPRKIAMIGLGGGSLAKYCYRHLPQAEITVFEIDPDVLSLRNEFAIPADNARFKVLLGDGAEFVKRVNNQFDVLMVDGFDVNGLPPQLSSQEFYHDCFASLAVNGIMVVNLWGSNQKYQECLTRIHNSSAGKLVVVNAADNINKIVLAVKGEEFAPSQSTLYQHAQLLGQSHPLNFHEKSGKLIRALLKQAA
jgi:spermidine synthase